MWHIVEIPSPWGSPFICMIPIVHFFLTKKLLVKCRWNLQQDVDPGFYFVGRIFDLPLRSKKEELTFCYGSNSSSDEDEEGGSREKVDRKRSNNNNNDAIGGISKTSTPGVKKSNKKNVKFDWIPPNVSENLVNISFDWKKVHLGLFCIMSTSILGNGTVILLLPREI